MTLAKSNINWTNFIWPIVEGCTPVSPGCRDCWASEFVGLRLAPAEEQRALQASFRGEVVPERFAGLTVLRDERHVFNGTVRFQPQLLDAPLRHKKPGRVFVAPRSDLFHEAVTDEQIAAAFGIMAVTPWLTHQVLTKRAERLPRWFAWLKSHAFGSAPAPGLSWARIGAWPLPNVHIGVTVEDQRHADARIPHLLAIPAAVRWLSVEPMLGPIDLTRAIHRCGAARDGECSQSWCPQVRDGEPQRSGRHCPIDDWHTVDEWESPPRIDWVVVGGESGRRARPFALEWADDVRRQCAAAGVSCFVKQAGSNAYVENLNLWPDEWASTVRQRRAPEGVTAAAAVGLRLRHRHGADLDELPEALRVREWPGEVQS